MTSILLIRTGRTDFDDQQRVQGTLDLPLSEQGWQQVAALAEELNQYAVEAVYAGPERATQQTAELVAVSLQKKVKTKKHLHNLNLGLWQGMLIQDVKTKQPWIYKQWLEHPETVCPPDGETLQSARQRLQAELAKVTKKHKAGTVALVLADPLASLLSHLLCEECLGNLWQACCEERPPWQMLTTGEPLAAATSGPETPDAGLA